MAYTFKQNMVSKDKYSIKCPYAMTPQYITIHNTSNNASAANEIKYMISNSNATSYHVAVDEKEVIQAIPFDRNAFHAGDGASGTGNRKSIGIEICRSTGDVETFKKCEANAAAYVAKLLKQYGWTTAKVKRHKDWSGKNCPHKTMELGWDRFVKMIQTELDKLNGKVTTTNTSSSSSLTGTNFQVRIKSATLNIRKTADFNSAVVGTVSKGQVFTITKVSNGLGCLKSGAGWISMNTQYVEKVEAAKPAAPAEYKVKIVNCTVLNARKGPGTNYEVGDTVKVGTVLTIVGETNGWLKTKSGLYISKTYTQRI